MDTQAGVRGSALRMQTVLLFLAAFTPGLGQTVGAGGATLSGAVTDPSGAGVPHARVVVTSTETGLRRVSETSEVGLYSCQLPVGIYDVAVTAEGFGTARRTGVRLSVGAPVTVDAQLEIGPAEESIVVQAEGAAVETARSSAATAISRVSVSELPVNGRNFLDFTVLTPGVVRDVRAGDLSFAGQRGPANTLLVDGSDTNNLFWGQAMGRSGFRPYTFSEDAVEEFQVSASGLDAETGRATGGAVNVVTRRGTNDLHGSVFEFYRDRGLNAATFIENRSGQKKQPYHYHQFGSSVGGPFVKDKLFFFGSYDGQRNKSTQPVVPNVAPGPDALARLAEYLQPYELGLNNSVWLGKLDWNAASGDRLSVRYSAGRFNGHNYEGAGLASAREHTGDTLSVTDSAVVQYTKVLGTRLVWDTRFNFVRDHQPAFANTTGVETVIVNGISFGKRAFDPQYNSSRSYQPVSTLSYITGRHSLKAGSDLLFSRIDNFFPGYFAGSYTFPSYAAFLAGKPSSYRQAFSRNGTEPPLDHPDVNEAAVFVQDSWRVSKKLTVNAGLRYDRFGYRQPEALNPDPGLAAQGLRTDRIPIDNRNFGPRMGLAWAPAGGERTVIRAGYGIYYGRTPSILRNRVMLQNGVDVVTYNLTSHLPVYPETLTARPAVRTAPPDIEAMDPGYLSPAAQQYSAQVEHAASSGWSVTAGFLGVHGTHLSRTRDISLYPSELAQAAIYGAGTTQFWRHPGESGPYRPNPAFGRITVYDAGGDSRYSGGFLQLSKRFGLNFQMLACYTLAKVVDTNPDSIPTPGSPEYDVKVPQDTLRPDLERGPGLNDIRHRLVMSGVWTPFAGRRWANGRARQALSGWQISSVVQVQSGRPFSIMASGDPGNDGNNYNDRAPLVGRNTYRGPGLATLDLRVARDVPVLGERMRLRLLAEGFDVTNRANFDALQMTRYTYRNFVFTPAANFGMPLSVYAPGAGSRVLQLAAKILF